MDLRFVTQYYRISVQWLAVLQNSAILAPQNNPTQVEKDKNLNKARKSFEDLNQGLSLLERQTRLEIQPMLTPNKAYIKSMRGGCTSSLDIEHGVSMA